jgi:hypothetical protein
VKRLLPALALLALIILAVLLWRGRSAAPEVATLGTPGTTARSKTEAPKSKIPLPLDLTNLATDLNSPAHDIAADLRIVSTMIDTYRSNFPHDGNPVGDNREITAALAGDNRLRLALIPKNHPAINRDGELCDRWGTPFFFHAESGTQMGIRSAGPDKKLFTADDVVRSP